jgi:hypothetical protein
MTKETQTDIAEFAPGIAMHHATRAKATKLMVLLAAEYPKLQLLCDTEEDDSGKERAVAFEVEFDGEDELIYEGDKVPSLAELLDTCAERELDPSADDEEEERASGSVVPEQYRIKYKLASSNGQSNGDWLAEWLVERTNGVNGFNADDFRAICETNGLDLTKGWALLPTSGQPGWQGRYRMNGRQVMEKVVAKQGYILDAMGVNHSAPEAFMAIMRDKHAAWLAKQAKIEAAQAKAIKEAVEGPTEA